MKCKKLLFLILFLIIIVIILVSFKFVNTNKSLSCELKDSNDINNTSVTVKVYDNISKYSINYLYNYNEGYMDNIVDKYDSVKAYLNIINKKDGINSNINQEGYKLEYSIDLELDKINKEDYKLLEIDEVTKLNSIKDIKKYYEDLGYICK